MTDNGIRHKQLERLRARMERMEKLPIKSARDVANEAFKASETKPNLDKVTDFKPKPRLNASVSVLEAFWGWIVGYAKQQTIDSFDGKPVTNPFKFIGILTNWKVLLIGVVVLAALYLTVRFVL